MSDGARTVLEEDCVVAKKMRPSVKYGKIPDIGPGLDAEANQFRLRLNRAIEAEVTRAHQIGVIT